MNTVNHSSETQITSSVTGLDDAKVRSTATLLESSTVAAVSAPAPTHSSCTSHCGKKGAEEQV